MKLGSPNPFTRPSFQSANIESPFSAFHPSPALFLADDDRTAGVAEPSPWYSGVEVSILCVWLQCWLVIPAGPVLC